MPASEPIAVPIAVKCTGKIDLPFGAVSSVGVLKSATAPHGTGYTVLSRLTEPVLALMPAASPTIVVCPDASLKSLYFTSMFKPIALTGLDRLPVVSLHTLAGTSNVPVKIPVAEPVSTRVNPAVIRPVSMPLLVRLVEHALLVKLHNWLSKFMYNSLPRGSPLDRLGSADFPTVPSATSLLLVVLTTV